MLTRRRASGRHAHNLYRDSQAPLRATSREFWLSPACTSTAEGTACLRAAVVLKTPGAPVHCVFRRWAGDARRENILKYWYFCVFQSADWLDHKDAVDRCIGGGAPNLSSSRRHEDSRNNCGAPPLGISRLVNPYRSGEEHEL